MEHDEMCPVDLRQRKAYDGCLCDGPDSLIARVRADERTKAAGRVDAAEICTCDPRWDGFNKGQHRDWCVRMVTLAAIREAE